jgi:hypothetical protein
MHYHYQDTLIRFSALTQVTPPLRDNQLIDERIFVKFDTGRVLVKFADRVQLINEFT